jgi:glucose/arabinose dehydrogenase
LLGAMLRIDIDVRANGAYGIPSDNPFVDGQGGAPEVWATGLRNPWRFSFDAATGDLWIGDVGQNEIEEIDLLPAIEGEPAGKGANLGWNLVEGTQEFEGSAPPDHIGPVYEYDHDDGNCSVTGGYVYRGSAIPDLTGACLFADYCVSQVRGLRVADGVTVDEHGFDIGSEPNTLVSFGQDAAGELYVLNGTGEISRIVAG